MPASFNVVSYSSDNVKMVYCHSHLQFLAAGNHHYGGIPSTRRSGGKHKSTLKCGLFRTLKTAK
jgi:hypothetical protein